MNPLITNINAHVQSETLATRTIIAWNPVANTGSINYEWPELLRPTLLLKLLN